MSAQCGFVCCNRTVRVCFLFAAFSLTMPCPAPAKDTQKQQTRAIKLVVRWPGMPPEAVDDQIAFPSFTRLAQLQSVHRMTSISTFDQTELYIEAGSNTSPAAFSRAVIDRLPSLLKDLPADAYVSQFQSLKHFSAPPEIKIRTVSHFQLSIDGKKGARYGIPRHAVFAQIKAQSIDLNERPPKEKTLQALRGLSIRTPGGKTIRLRDLAEIKIVKTPSHRVRHWPPADAKEP